MLQMHMHGFIELGLGLTAARGAKTDSKAIEDIGPQVLTMDHLAVAFIACTVPLILAVLVFVSEIFLPRLKRFAQNRLMN